jgi:hypothetical protein
MFTRKTQKGASSAIWPYTPEASPRLAPAGLEVHTEEDFAMSEEEFKPSRPISLAAPREGSGTLSPGSRPTLQDVLNNKAPQPYTLTAFMAFLSQQHCLETLEFTLEAQKYHEKYDQAAANTAEIPLDHDSEEGFELEQDWVRLLDIYVKPGAPREINLPAIERDDLVDYPLGKKPPPPEALDPAVKRMYDLMSDSIFIPFCNSLKEVPHAQTYNALSDFGGRLRGSTLDASRSTFDDRTGMHQRVPSQRRRSPPTTSPVFEKPDRSSSSTSHRHTQSSNLSSALGLAASNRLSTHVSISSAASQAEYALTDDSGSGDSPAAREPITPPTTPPMSDVHPSSSITSGVIPTSPPKTNRSDSGNWKKMGRALWGKQKKSQGTLRERDNES